MCGRRKSGHYYMHCLRRTAVVMHMVYHLLTIPWSLISTYFLNCAPSIVRNSTT